VLLQPYVPSNTDQQIFQPHPETQDTFAMKVSSPCIWRRCLNIAQEEDFDQNVTASLMIEMLNLIDPRKARIWAGDRK